MKNTVVKSMQSKKNNEHSQHNVFTREEEYLLKGQKIIYEGEIACVIRVTPLPVIKTRDRIVCGTLHKHLRMQGNKLP
jgi:hypothetical protein